MTREQNFKKLVLVVFPLVTGSRLFIIRKAASLATVRALAFSRFIVAAVVIEVRVEVSAIRRRKHTHVSERAETENSRNASEDSAGDSCLPQSEHVVVSEVVVVQIELRFRRGFSAVVRVGVVPFSVLFCQEAVGIHSDDNI